MAKRASVHVVVVLCLLALWSISASAAVRFNAVLPQSEQLKAVAEYSVLQYASPTLGDLFNGVSGPAVKLTIQNTGSSPTWVRVKGRVLHNNRELAMVVFGKAGTPGGIAMQANSTVDFELDMSGLNATDVVNDVLATPGHIRNYLDDFADLDVMNSRFDSTVLSEGQLMSAYLSRGTLPNGRYTIEVSVLEYNGSTWVDVPGTDRRTFDIMETSIEPISPRGNLGDVRPEALEFEVTGFPAQVSCFNATAELTSDGSVVWTSSAVKVGTGCSFVPNLQGTAKVVINVPSSVRLIGGLNYNWSVKIKDQGGKTVAQTVPIAFSLVNHAPVVTIDGAVEGELSLRRDESYTFEAVVTDAEDDALGFNTLLEWQITEPGNQVRRLNNTDTVTWAFRTAGKYKVELRATDKLGLKSTAIVNVTVAENNLPVLNIASVQYVRDGNSKDVGFSFDGKSVKLQKTVYRPGDQLLISARVSDADNEPVTVTFRNRQTTLGSPQQMSGGSGDVVASVALDQQTTYNISIEAIDARDGKAAVQVEPVRVVPSSKPQVTIVRPERNARFVEGTVVTFEAIAQDADDPKPTIKWYRVNGAAVEEIGQGSTITYTIQEGRTVVRAQATSIDPDSQRPKPDAGVAEITVTGVPNQAPAVRIIAPSEGLLLTAERDNVTNKLTFRAEASDSDGPAALSYTWYVNDQQVANGASFTYDFRGLGAWTVKVEASDSRDKSSASVLLAVSRRASINVSINLGTEANLPQGSKIRPSVTYSGTSSRPVVTWLLSGKTANDQQISEQVVAVGENPEIQLGQPGEFKLKAVVVDGDVRGEASVQLVVAANNSPQVSSVVWSKSVFVGDSLKMAAGNATGDVVVSVSDEDGDAINNVRWKIGDQVVASADSFVYTFNRPGKHVITVEVEDARGGVGQGTVTVQVVRDEQPPVVVISSPVQGSSLVAYSPVNLAAVANDPEGGGRVVEQAWSIDGKTLATGQTSFVPTEERNYTVTYTVRDVAGNYGGASVQISAVRPSVAILSPTVGAAFTMSSNETGLQPLNVSLVADLVGLQTEAEYTFAWYVKSATGDEQLVSRRQGDPAAQYSFVLPGSYTLRVEALPQAAPGVAPLQALTSVVVMAPVQGAGLDKTVAPNAAPQITKAWISDPATGTELGQVELSQGQKDIRLYAEVSDPDNSGPVIVVWEHAGTGIGAAVREGDTNLYHLNTTLSQPGNYSFTVVATDARGDRVASQVDLTVTTPANLPPVIESIAVDSTVEQNVDVELQATVRDPEGRLLTVTWMLDGKPVASGALTGNGTVSNTVRFASAGRYTLVVKAEDVDGGAVVSAPQTVTVADSAEPIIISPSVVGNAIPIVSNPVEFVAQNVEPGSDVRWVSSKDGELATGVTSFEATLSPGQHEITLWVDGVGVSIDIMAQEQASLFEAVGVVVGWTGNPSLSRSAVARGQGHDDKPQIISFGKSKQLSEDERTVLDIDTLQIGRNDTITVLIYSTNRQIVYGQSANGKMLDSEGGLVEP